MIMVSKGPDELSKNDKLLEAEVRGSDCTVNMTFKTVSRKNVH